MTILCSNEYSCWISQCLHLALQYQIGPEYRNNDGKLYIQNLPNLTTKPDKSKVHLIILCFSLSGYLMMLKAWFLTTYTGNLKILTLPSLFLSCFTCIWDVESNVPAPQFKPSYPVMHLRWALITANFNYNQINQTRGVLPLWWQKGRWGRDFGIYKSCYVGNAQ